MGLAFQAEGEAALDELHRLFQRNILSRCDQSVKVIRHDDPGMEEKSPLMAIVEDRSLEQFRRGRDLKKTAALRRYRGDEIRPGFLRSPFHGGRIHEKPAAKADFFFAVFRGLKVPAPSRFRTRFHPPMSEEEAGGAKPRRREQEPSGS